MEGKGVKPTQLVNKPIAVSLQKTEVQNWSPSFVIKTSKNEIYLLTCFSNVKLTLGYWLFKNSKNLSASDSQLKRHIISSTYRL